MHIKRLASVLSCLVIIFISVPTIAFADPIVDQWNQVTTNEQLVQAFQYYCKSRDLTIEGSAADVVTKFTTSTFNNICRGVGIDVTALQAHLKYATDQNGQIKFLFDSNGLTAYNMIFAQFLQDNDLSVGDSIPSDDPKTIYSGSIFTDLDGNSCLVSFFSSSSDTRGGQLTTLGNAYLGYDGAYASSCSYNNGLHDLVGFNFNYVTPNANPDIFYLSQYPQSNGDMWYQANPGPYNIWNGSDQGFYTVAYNTRINKYSIGIATIYGNGYYYAPYYIILPNDLNGDSTVDVNVVINVTTNNQTINNNTYEGDTVINPDGTPTTPDSGGGGGSDSNPSGGTPPNWDIGGGDGTLTDPNGNTWNINFPEFKLPDLNIDWSINGLGNKFPFSIPFDLVALVTVLNAEPEAPRFQGTVNFGFTTWDYDINLQSFDTVASVCRIAELLLLVFGLIMVTRSIIKG